MSHYPAVFCILMVGANTWRLKSHLWGQQIAHACVRREEENPSAREQPGAPVHSLAGPQEFLRARVWAGKNGSGSFVARPWETWLRKP